MWAVRDASRFARPMYMIEICLKCKHFIQNSEHMHEVLNSYKTSKHRRTEAAEVQGITHLQDEEAEMQGITRSQDRSIRSAKM